MQENLFIELNDGDLINLNLVILIEFMPGGIRYKFGGDSCITELFTCQNAFNDRRAELRALLKL